MWISSTTVLSYLGDVVQRFQVCTRHIFQEAKEKFQQLQKVISILGDEEKRAVYDETGYAGDDVSALFLDVLSSL